MIDDRNDGAPQRRRAGVQIVVAQRRRAQHTGQRRKMLLVGNEIWKSPGGFVVLQVGQLGRGRFVLAPRRGQADPQEPGPQPVPGRHVVGLGSGQGVRVRGEAIVDAAHALLGAVVGGAVEVELTEQGEDLQGEIVPVLPFDLGQDGQQDVLGRLFLGGQDELASALQLAGDRHG